MSTLKKIPLPGYMTAGASASRLEWKGDMFGNNSYQQGGDVLSASDFGLVGIESFSPSLGSYSFSGTYFVKVTPPSGSSNINEVMAPTYNNATVLWYYSANNVQVANNANLSLEGIRLSVVGV